MRLWFEQNMVRNSNDFVQTIISYRVLTPRYQTTLVLGSLEPHLSNKKNSSKNINFKRSNFDFYFFCFFQKISENFQKSLPKARNPVPPGATWCHLVPPRSISQNPVSNSRSMRSPCKEFAVIKQVLSDRFPAPIL